MATLADKLRTSKEKLYGGVMLGVGVILWPIFTLGIIAGLFNPNPQVAVVSWTYFIYGAAIALFVWLSGGFYRATAFGNMVLVGPNQFPQLHAMVLAGAKELGMGEAPRAFLYNSNGLFNAFARRLLGGRFVFLTAALVDASSDEQVRFVIGHELGHHAAGHCNPWMNLLKMPAYVVPFLQPAYSRQREFTCDAIGAHISNDLPVSRAALMMLGCGCGRLNRTMNLEAFMAQEAMMPPTFGFINEKFRSHPRLTRRMAALKTRGVDFSA